MLDHVGIAVADAERSRRFYEQALAPLGISLIMSVTPEQTEAGGTAHGFGSDGKPYFWIGDNERWQTASTFAPSGSNTKAA